MTFWRVVTTMAAGLWLAGCRPGIVSATQEAGGPRPLQRFLLGPGHDLKVSPALRDAVAQPHHSVLSSRQLSWQLFQAVVDPVPLHLGTDTTLPAFRTWYGRDEILGLLGHITLQKPQNITDAMVDEAFVWLAQRGAGRGDEEEAAVLRNQAAADPANADGLAGLTKVLYSPTVTRDLLLKANTVRACWQSSNEPIAMPCLSLTESTQANVIKLRWLPLSGWIPLFDTSPESFAAQYARGQWLPDRYRDKHAVTPIYTQRVNGELYGLVAINLLSKVGPTWFWQAFWFSDKQGDFAAGRPSFPEGSPWNHMKSCAVSDFKMAQDDLGDSSLKQIYQRLQADRGLRSWCSNPYLEPDVRGSRTNCVGCHQFNGHERRPDRISQFPREYPNDISDAVNAAPVFDYLWSLPAGGQLAPAMATILGRGKQH